MSWPVCNSTDEIMKIDLKKIKINSRKVGFFRFKQLENGDFLLTNDFGFFAFLSPAEFKDYLEGKLDKEGELHLKLKEEGFIKDASSLDGLVKRYADRNCTLLMGPNLHIIVVSLRCNTKCVYCQASSRPMECTDYDMDKKTAKKTVDLAFESPSPVLTIEFQGGEPLVNWPVVKYIIDYVKKKSKEPKNRDRKVNISMVTNFSLMTDDKLDFLVKNMVSLCTSLDGPEKIHVKNRPVPGANSYKMVTSWIKKIKNLEKERKKAGRAVYNLSALLTVTKRSLDYPKEIIDEYRKWGFEGIFLRPLSYLGNSGGGRAKDTIGYPVKDFLKFWKESMEHIISVNLKGEFFMERGSRIMLQKIFTDKDPGFTDLRSPCGAAVGQILYNHDGKIYTCDEGRMVGDDTFIIGDVEKSGYDDIIWNEKTKTMVTSSMLENFSCDFCVYKPYCGVCPVKNYALHGNLFPQMKNTEWCKLNMGQLDYLFEKMKDPEIEKIFRSWT